MLLTVDAVKEALQDAGADPRNKSMASRTIRAYVPFPRLFPIGPDELIDAMAYAQCGARVPRKISSQLGAVVAAAQAVRTGMCRHVICFRTVYEAAALANPQEWPPLRRDTVDGGSQWTAPFFA